MSGFNRLTSLEELTVDNIPAVMEDTSQNNYLFDKRRPGYKFHPHASDVFNKIAEYFTPAIRRYLLNNSYTPSSALTIVITRGLRIPVKFRTSELALLVKHKNFTPEMFHILWDELYTRHVVANNLPATMPVELFEKMNAGTGYPTGLASNPNTPVHILAQYSKFIPLKEKYITQALASNPSTPVDMLEKIAKRSHSYKTGVNISLLLNPSSSPQVIVHVWNTVVKGKDWRVIVNILNKRSRASDVLKRKGRLFLEKEQMGSMLKRNLIQSDYVAVLKPYYPEVTEDLPMVWLKELVSTFGRELYCVTLEELERQ